MAHRVPPPLSQSNGGKFGGNKKKVVSEQHHALPIAPASAFEAKLPQAPLEARYRSAHL
jgi:hypothetical protein